MSKLISSSMAACQHAIRNICCIGAGYVGGPSGAVIAFKAPHITVTVVDIDTARIAAWNSDELPLYEPQLKVVVETARDGVIGVRRPNLFFSTDIDRAVKEADLVFLGVNTPVKRNGVGAGQASDIGWLEAATRRIGKAADHDLIVVEKSTVPCGTASAIRQILAATAKSGVQFEVLSNPEFLAEGTAVYNLLHPDRVLIGSRENEMGYEAAQRLANLYAEWVPKEKIIMMNLWSSELSKLASNALLAQRISSINALSAVCEAVSANIDDVSFACGTDSRIGSKMMNASVGFGGSCLKKDVLNLVYIAKSLGLFEVASYWQAVVDINEYQKDRFCRRIVRAMHNTLQHKKIAILGFAYKKNTGDCRESAAITVVKGLLAENAIVAIFDPKVKAENTWHELGLSPDTRTQIRMCCSPYEACSQASAVVVLTEWDMFSNKVDFQTRNSRLNSPSHLTERNQCLVAGSDAGELVSESSRFSWTPPLSSDDGSSSIKSLSDHGQAENGTQTPQESSSDESVDEHTDREQIENDATKLNWRKVSQIMEKPMFVFDGRNILDVNALTELGFRVESIGRAVVDMN